MNESYKAVIYFDAIEDNYNDGEIGGIVNSWTETLEAPTTEELKQKIVDATYQEDFTTIDDEQINEYEHATEYHTSYLADDNNQGDASDQQIEQWRAGKLRLWAIRCHILVTKLTEVKAAL